MNDILPNSTNLQSYLNQQIEGFGEITSIEKFSDGQSNPTFLLKTNQHDYVLRKQPEGELLKSAHAVDREYRVIKALQNSDVPVATAIHLCNDRTIIGTLFFVMSYEPGRVFWNPTLPELSRSEKYMVYDEMNRVLASLHNVEASQVGLADFGRPGDYFSRQIERWSKQYRASETEKIPAMDRLIQWLPNNLPPDDGMISLIHGDFRIDNLIFHQNEPTARALLDWELSTLGHPFADIAYQCMQWRLPTDCVIPGLGDLDRSLLGIPDETEYIATYCERRKLAQISHWDFYLIFGFFRFAAILQGVLKRALDGNASSPKAFEYGALSPLLANMAIELTE